MADQPTRDSIQIARLEEQVAALRATVHEMAETLTKVGEQLDAVTRELEQARGGWKTLMLIGGAVGSLAGLVSWATSHVRIL